ncbi:MULTISPECIES: sugar phosphate isomerase/epimerase family protein [Halocynthiibacter]|uniref:Sugar phosphate isomerase/epimerase n=1 Tax=Halocynthiibacter halioticoli TaxID=2986804 RepID=A0AAE3J407_9RHOB|nr:MULTISPECIES: sugar phosphate isomerase/epimerase [Halocynthiibacter]MCV6825362.1 sugar phosphate isomerase/epimerase [Halocynthiibacter halioticoli]MCW4058363.1 sugar phosphate isomerase/epimerase [Halocynthiibacter sp. SDUM655004]
MSASFQLYSARDFTPWDDVFKTLSELGYTGVEGYGALYGDTDKVRAAMDATGLSMPTAHVGIDDLESNLEKVVEIAGALGIKTIYAPYLMDNQRPSDKAGWQAFAARLAAAQEALAAHGIGFGWHNHDFEFVATADGAVPMEVILEAAPKIEWEADIAWIVRGGGDPIAWITKYADRISAIHVKDIAPEGECTDEDGWADVGEGTMDWAGILDAVRTKTKAAHFVMEHDKPNDFKRFATRSINNYKAL